MWILPSILVAAAQVPHPAPAKNTPDDGQALVSRLEERDPPSIDELLKAFEPLSPLAELLEPVEMEGRATPLDPEELQRAWDRESAIKELRNALEFEAAAAAAEEFRASLASRLGEDHWRPRAEAMRFLRMQDLARREPAQAREILDALDARYEARQAMRDRRYEDVLKHARRALEIHQRLDSGHFGWRADVYDDLGWCWRALGEYPRAQLAARESLRLRLELGGPGQPDSAYSLDLLARILNAQRDIQRSIAAGRGAVGGLRAAYPLNPLKITSRLNLIAGSLTLAGDLELAQDFHERILAIHAEHGGRESDRAFTLGALADVLAKSGQLERAEVLLRESLLSQREQLGVHPSVLSTMEKLAQLLDNRGKYDESEALYLELLELAPELWPDDHPSRMMLYGNFASLLVARGRYVAAEIFSRRCIAGLTATFGAGHPRLAVARMNLAWVLHERGDFGQAEAEFEQALAIQRAAVEGDHPVLVQFLSNSASLSIAGGRLQEAELRLREASAMAERLHGRQHPDYLHARDTLGDVLNERGDHAAAEEVLREVLAGRVATLGPEHPDVATTRGRLARALEGRGELGEAERECRTALASSVASRGEDHPRTIELRYQLGRGLRRRGQLAEAEDQLVRTLESIESERTKVIGIERERALFAKRLEHQEVTEELFRIAAEDGRAWAAVAYAEQGRGRAFLDLLERSETIQEPTAPIETLQAALSGDEKLLSYQWSQEDVRLAILGAAGEPQLFVLVDGVTAVAELRASVVELKRSLERRGSGATKHRSSVAAALLPDPVRAHLADARRLVVLPDGPLAGLPFGVLCGSQSEWGHIAEFAVAPSMASYVNRRRLARQSNQAGERTRDILILADPSFAKEPEVSADRLEDSLRRKEAASDLERVRLFGETLEPLPGTRFEAAAIARVLEGVGGTARLLTGTDANLLRLEAELAGQSVLHFATHGMPGSAERPYDACLALASPKDLDRAGRFLTLEHICEHWRGRLSKTDLVVLSACESRRGAEVGDSSMSLPWGFFYAGTPTVIASSWMVDDRATALLMSRFYENLFGHHAGRVLAARSFPAGAPLPKASALREAQIWLATADRHAIRAAESVLREAFLMTEDEPGRTRAAGTPGREVDAGELNPYADPYYWASFVLIGSPD